MFQRRAHGKQRVNPESRPPLKISRYDTLSTTYSTNIITHGIRIALAKSIEAFIDLEGSASFSNYQLSCTQYLFADRYAGAILRLHRLPFEWSPIYNRLRIPSLCPDSYFELSTLEMYAAKCQ